MSAAAPAGAIPVGRWKTANGEEAIWLSTFISESSARGWMWRAGFGREREKAGASRGERGQRKVAAVSERESAREGGDAKGQGEGGACRLDREVRAREDRAAGIERARARARIPYRA